MEKKCGSRSKLKKVSKFNKNSSKKLSYSSSNNSSSDSDSDSSLSRDNEWEELIHTIGHKEKNRLDHVGPDNIKENNNQHNDAIEYDPKFDNKLVCLEELRTPYH